MCVVPCCRLKFFVYSKKRSTWSEHRNRTMCEVVAFKRWKTRKNYQTACPETCSRSLTGGGSLRDWEWFVWVGGREGIILLVIKWLKSFSSLIILLTGYFSSAFHSLSLTAVVFYPLRWPLAQEFSCSQGWIKPYIVHVVVAGMFKTAIM